ncbi:uncharacterized protein [Haliotis asinina]|uniref:uncharacterized protein n=1 Tax=Haliotis asinina TaxID=109174 RepID=UPI0035327284
MATCVESLYTLDGGATDKRKTLAMIRILKGAVSESKSKAGQAVCRYNKHDKKALKRQLALLDNDASRTEIDVDNQKRVILRKWSMVFENQKNISDSLKRFDEMLRAAMADADKDEDVEDALEEKSEKRVPDCTEGKRILDRPCFTGRNDSDSTGKRLNNHPVMPKLPTSGFLVQTSTSKSIEEKQENGNSVSKVTSSFPSLVNDFLEDQKQIQEQLLTRNKLCKLKKTVDSEHTFYKLRMKSKLPSDPASLLLKIEKDRLLPKRTTDHHLRYQSLDNLGDVTRRGATRLESRSLIQITQTVDRRSSEVFKLTRSKTLNTF